VNPIRPARSLGIPAIPALVLALAPVLALVGACGAILPPGLMAASRLDPLTTPPAAIGLAVGVPDTVVLADGDATLRIALAADGEMLVDTIVPLAIRRDAAGMPTPALPGEIVYAASLAPAEAATFAAAQAEIRRLRAGGTEGEGSFSITVVGGCRTGAPLDALPVTTWLRTDPTVPFTPLTRKTDVLAKLRQTGATLPRC
jgi:hypothetical protein